MKTYRRVEVQFHAFFSLILGLGESLFLKKESLMPPKQQIWWTAAMTLWRKVMFLAPPGIELRLAGCPACSLINILTKLFLLFCS
jgi:hypothetical protein